MRPFHRYHHTSTSSFSPIFTSSGEPHRRSGHGDTGPRGVCLLQVMLPGFDSRDPSVLQRACSLRSESHKVFPKAKKEERNMTTYKGMASDRGLTNSEGPPSTIHHRTSPHENERKKRDQHTAQPHFASQKISRLPLLGLLIEPVINPALLPAALLDQPLPEKTHPSSSPLPSPPSSNKFPSATTNYSCTTSHPTSHQINPANRP